MTQAARDQNRALFPFAAALMDELRAELGNGVNLTLARENGREVGRIWEDRMADMPKKWNGA